MKFPPGLTADWPLISDLLDEALALPRAEREQWLQALSGDRSALRETLRGLLANEAQVESSAFLDSLPPISGLPPPAPELCAGDVVGPYRVLREIATGGMGAVWLAERADGVLKRQIALKLPRMTWIAGLAERMERERDILSSLEHPNIARLYDAGVDSRGRPFLAIEYVQGERIDTYCDARKLGVRERITLFLQVLDAVRYAHSHLVIHRDVKPANVLVNERGQPQLLDFGIARLQDASVDQNAEPAVRRTITDLGARAMTLRYASPEQVQGRSLSVATDVYSLGVLLYELLTGVLPYVTRKGTSAEIEVAITESQLRLASRVRIEVAAATARASSPEKISRLLRGDLDAVLLRALAREVSDRFASVEAFQQDLRRWLEGQPVSAQPASRLYVLRKFVLRNRWSVALGSAAMVAIVVVGIVAVWLAIAAREESRKATAARDFMLDLFEQANPALHGGRDVTARQLLLDSESQMRDTLGDQPLMRAEVLSNVAALWERLGDPQRARAAMEQRARVMSRSGDGVGVAVARIDEATRAIAAGDVEHARAVLQDISLPAREEKLPIVTRVDLRLNRAWLALQADAIKEADRNFSLAFELAREADNVDRQLIALYGRIRTAWSQGDVERARRDQRTAMALLSATDLMPTERINRGADLLGWAYRLGDYRQAWPVAQSLVADSTRIYGPDAASQQDLRLQWLRLAWRVQDPEPAFAWLRGIGTRPAADAASSTIASARIDQRVAEAAIWSLADDNARVRMALDQAWIELGRHSSFGHDARRSLGRRLALAEAAEALRSGAPARAASWLGDRVWDQARWPAPPPSRARTDRPRVAEAPADVARARREVARWAAQAGKTTATNPAGAPVAYRWFAMGLAAEGLGRPEEAARLLERACKTVEAALGPNHPDTAILAVNALLFDIRNNKGGIDRNEQYLNRTEELLSALRRSFPENHTALQKLRWLQRRLRDAPERSPLAGVDRKTRREVTRPEQFF